MDKSRGISGSFEQRMTCLSVFSLVPLCVSQSLHLHRLSVSALVRLHVVTVTQSAQPIDTAGLFLQAALPGRVRG